MHMEQGPLITTMDVADPSSRMSLRVRRRACLNCTSAKVKCTSASLGAESCGRCERLGKECIYAEPSVDVRRTRRDLSSATRLEEKVEVLSEQIATLTQQIRTTTFQGSQNIRPIAEIPDSSFSSSHKRMIGSPLMFIESVPRTRDVHNDSSTNVVLHDLGGLEAADHRLDIFRRDLVSYFPFVIVPPTVGVEALRHESPFLFLCIMAVTSFEDSVLQRRLGDEIKKQICHRLVMGREICMDLLQGLLVFVAWYQYFCVPGRHQYFLMVQLCVNMCHELGLDLNEKGKRGLEEVSTQWKPRDPAEMRALLGTYHLSSTYALSECSLCFEDPADCSILIRLSMVLRKRTIIHYTSYMQHCCATLSQQKVAPSDQSIASYIEVQVLQTKISESFCYNDISACDLRGERALKIAVDSFSREVDEMKRNIGSTTMNAVLGQYLCFLDVWIREVAIYNEPWESTFVPVRLAHPTIKHTFRLSISRANMLRQLVAATTSFHDWCLSVENAKLFHFPFSWWAVLSYVLIIQVRTIFLDCGTVISGTEQINPREKNRTDLLEVDFRRFAEEEVMIPHILDVYMGKLATMTTQLIDDDGNRDMIYQYGALLRTILSGYESRIGGQHGPAPGQIYSLQKQPAILQPSLGAVRNTGIQESVSQEFALDQVELETAGPSGSFASQPSLHFDLPEPEFADLVWDTMMNDVSFFATHNG